MRITVGMAVLAVGLAGCAGGGASLPASTSASAAVASSTPTPTKVEAVKYDAVVDLKEAAVAAGMPCPSWDESNRVENAAGSGTCSDSDVLSVYLTEDVTANQVVLLKQLGGEVHLLVGPNWIINHSDVALLRELKRELGGTVVLGAAS